MPTHQRSHMRCPLHKNIRLKQRAGPSKTEYMAKPQIMRDVKPPPTKNVGPTGRATPRPAHSYRTLAPRPVGRVPFTKFGSQDPNLEKKSKKSL
jgi:hypothetical protein